MEEKTTTASLGKIPYDLVKTFKIYEDYIFILLDYEKFLKIKETTDIEDIRLHYFSYDFVKTNQSFNEEASDRIKKKIYDDINPLVSMKSEDFFYLLLSQ